ncbi:MAG TPA: relaxase/mobilization nuclease domain-containing protein, partial [Coleofasciculaceae cyanobacterium]
MIGKVLQNNSFSETTGYVLGKEKVKWLGGTLIEYETDIVSQQFLMSRDINPQIERPVYHLIQSYSYEDAATHDLTDEFMLNRAIDHFAGLVVSARHPELLRQDDKSEFKRQVQAFIDSELYEYQWFCAAHEDTQHQHSHFVASRINLVDGRCIPTWQDKERSHRVCREIEKDHGLRPLQSFYELERRSLTRGQTESWQKTGIPPLMTVMQEAIVQEATPGRSFEAVVAALQEGHGIKATVGLYHAKQGVVFEKVDDQGDIVRLSGSQLGRGFTFQAIHNRLGQEVLLLPDAPQAQVQEESDEELLKEPDLTEGLRQEQLPQEPDLAEGLRQEQLLQEPDLTEELRREQADFAEHLAPLVKQIWQLQKLTQPLLQSATFEDYSIRLSQQGNPELYRRDLLLLGHSDNHDSDSGSDRPLGLSQPDGDAIHSFLSLSQHQAREHLLLLHQQQLEMQKSQKTQKKRHKSPRS